MLHRYSPVEPCSCPASLLDLAEVNQHQSDVDSLARSDSKQQPPYWSLLPIVRQTHCHHPLRMRKDVLLERGAEAYRESTETVDGKESKGNKERS